MEQITFNPNNEPYYSEDFIKGFKCGAERQFEADKSDADRPQGHYIKGENGEWYCSECKRIDDKYSVARFCWHCGARMKGADDE